MNPSEPLARLLDLSHQLGREDRKLAILGEGNTSTRASDGAFFVKASGSNLATLGANDVTECDVAKIISLLSTEGLSDSEIDDALLAARVSPDARKPSVEAMFHAWLLTLPGVNFVGHTHPVAANILLCSKHARLFAASRIFPDEIVCCGVESVFVPYTDPGLELARAIKVAVEEFITRLSRPPRVIHLENHGIIALGATPQAVLAATLMTVKAAEIFVGAMTVAGEPQFLTPDQIHRIAGRPDEHYRQKALGI